jgi:hypothetical protein
VLLEISSAFCNCWNSSAHTLLPLH